MSANNLKLSDLEQQTLVTLQSVAQESRYILARSSAQGLQQSCWPGIGSNLGLGWGRICLPTGIVVGSIQSVAIVGLRELQFSGGCQPEVSLSLLPHGLTQHICLHHQAFKDSL